MPLIPHAAANCSGSSSHSLSLTNSAGTPIEPRSKFNSLASLKSFRLSPRSAAWWPITARCRRNGFSEYAARRKIERQVAKAVHEHLIVFTDARRPCKSGNG